MNEKPLFQLQTVSPRAGLLEQVIVAIQHKQQTLRLWRMRLSMGAGIASIAALVPAVMALVTAFRNSHFSAYLSLVFSDGSVAFSSWKVMMLSLLESLPMTVLAVTAALIGVLVWSLRMAARSVSFASPLISNA